MNIGKKINSLCCFYKNKAKQKTVIKNILEKKH